MSKEAQPLFRRGDETHRGHVARFAAAFFPFGRRTQGERSWAPGQLRSLIEGRPRTRPRLGLWNFFLPHSEIGRGLTNISTMPTGLPPSFGKQAARIGVAQLLGAGTQATWEVHREKSANPEQTGEVLKAAAQRRDSLGPIAMTRPNVRFVGRQNVATRAEFDGGTAWSFNGEQTHLGRRRIHAQIIDWHGQDSPDASTQFQQSQDPGDDRTRPAWKILGDRVRVLNSHAPPTSATTTRRAEHAPSSSTIVPGLTQGETSCWAEAGGFEISQVRLRTGPHPSLHGLDGARPRVRASNLMVKRGSTATDSART